MSAISACIEASALTPRTQRGRQTAAGATAVLRDRPNRSHCTRSGCPPVGKEETGRGESGPG